MIPIISHTDFARLHPTGDHPERQERLVVLQEAFPNFEEPRRATEAELGYCHDPDYIRTVRETSESGRTVLLDPDSRAEVAFVADNPGNWMFHCHVLEHQASGLMAVIRVA